MYDEASGVSHEAIVRHVCSFLDSHGYSNSLMALQAESGTPYNVIRLDSEGDAAEAKANFESAVLEGNWDVVLSVYMDKLLIPSEIKAALYVLIFEEMLELHGLFYQAKTFLMNAPIFEYVKSSSPLRYAHLEQMLSKYDVAILERQSDSVEYKNIKNHFHERRAQVHKELLPLITFSSSGRLPENELLVQLFMEHATRDSEAPAKRFKSEGDREEPDKLSTSLGYMPYPITAPKTVERRIPFEGEHAASTCMTLPNHLTAVGRIDGKIDFIHAQHNTVERTVGHPSRAGVLTFALNEVASKSHSSTSASQESSAWLAVGYRDGCIKIFDCTVFKLLRKFSDAHKLGVTCIIFVGSPNDIQLSGHSSFIISGSFDSTIKLWSIAEGVCLQTVSDGHRSAAIHSLCPLLVSRPAAVSRADTDSAAFLSAGDDSRVSCWHTTVGVKNATIDRVGQPVALQRFHAAFDGTEIPSQMEVLPPVGNRHVFLNDELAASTTEVLIVTRSTKAAIIRFRVMPHRLENPVETEMLCLMESPSALLTVSPKVIFSPAQSLPLLSVYAWTANGSLLLYNIEMVWREPERWKALGGCVKADNFVDGSVVLSVEGKAINDLHFTRLTSERAEEGSENHPALFACSASLDTAYVLR